MKWSSSVYIALFPDFGIDKEPICMVSKFVAKSIHVTSEAVCLRYNKDQNKISKKPRDVVEPKQQFMSREGL